MIHIRQLLKEAQDRKTSYVDAHRVEKNYKVGDTICIGIRPNKSTIGLGRVQSCHLDS